MSKSRRSAEPRAPDALLQLWLAAPAGASLVETWGEEATEAISGLQSALFKHARTAPNEALRAVRRIADAERGTFTKQDRARLTRLEGHVLASLGRFRESEACYRAAWTRLSGRSDQLERGYTGIGLVHVLSQMSRYDEASDLATSVRKLIGSKDRLARARLDTNHANILMLSGRPQGAIEKLRRARRAFKSVDYVHDAALVTYNLGYVLVREGRLREAQRHFREAEEGFAQRGVTLERLYARREATLTSMMLGQWKDSIEALEEIQDQLESLGDRRAVPLNSRYVAEFLGSLGILDRAQDFARKAYAGYRDLGLRTDTAEAGFLHGRILASMNRQMDARVRLEDCLDHWRASPNARSRRRTEVELAAVLLARGAHEEALALLRGASRYLTRVDPHGAGVRCRHLMAEAHLHANRRATAARLARSAFKAARRYPAVLDKPWIALTVARAIASPRSRGETLLWARRSVREMEKVYLALGTAAMRGQLSASRERVYRGVVEVVLQAGGPNAAQNALDLLARARSPQLIEDLMRDEPGMDEGLRAEIARLRDELLDEAESGPGDVRARTMAGRLKALDRLLERRLAHAPRIVRDALDARGFRQWSRKLKDCSLIYYDQDGAQWTAYVVDPEKKVRRVPLPGAADALRSSWKPLRFLIEQAAHLPTSRRRDFLRETTQEANESMDRLRATLWEPLAVEPGKVVVIPSGDANGLPLESLVLTAPNAESDWVVSRWPHPAVIRGHVRRSRHRGAKALVLHDQSPGGASEAERLGQLLQSHEIEVARGSSRASLLAEEAPLAVLHVAAHGAYHRDKWMLNGIRLSDGWLGFEQLKPRHLRGALVVFGSCESGLRSALPGSEIDGWLSAGLAAGAEEMLLALWKIDDAAATMFAECFYSHWCHGTSAAEAAARARLEVREQLPHPFSWASFLSVG